jgi:N-acetylglutamate synthase-like GNAT family acetyltransferase
LYIGKRINNSMQLEKLTCANIENIRHLQPNGWPDITKAFTFYTANEFCNPIKVSVAGKIIGIGCSISFEKTAWLAHIIVSDDYRNQGVGSAIVDELLNNSKTKGIETVLLVATELGEPVYTKAGFSKVSEYRYFRKEKMLPKNVISDKIQPYKKEFHKDIIQLDRCISGENREKLLEIYLGKSFVFIDNNVVCGYFMPDLGEGPVLACTIEAGIELMRFRYSDFERATIPEENKTGIEFLHRIGFVETETKGTRMILGKEVQWKPEMIYSRIGGNFG